LADKLADYAQMDAHDANISRENPAHESLPLARPRRALWLGGLLLAAVVTVLIFGAYRQPELLLNLMGLRYCG
jgi:hypothetical protein